MPHSLWPGTGFTLRIELLLLPSLLMAGFLLHSSYRDIKSPKLKPLSWNHGSNPVRIYVAELPKKYNYDLLGALSAAPDHNQLEFLSHITSTPHGRLLNATADDSDDLRSPYYHGLDVLFHMQLLASPLREHNASMADIIYVPFYVHKIYQLKEHYRADFSKVVQEFWAEAPRLLPYFSQKPHWITVADLEADLMEGCGGWPGVNFLCHPDAEHFVWTTPELFTGARKKSDAWTLGQRHDPNPNAVSMPYLSHVSRSQGSAVEPFNSTELFSGKYVLMAEAMRLRNSVKTRRGKWGLQGALKADCKFHEQFGDCVYYDPSGDQSRRLAFHEDVVRLFDYSTVITLARQAWFALIEPSGDLPTRLALWDAFQSSTIPVVFDDHLFSVLPFADLIDYSAFMLVKPDTWKGSFVVEVKRSATFATRLEALASLHKVRHALQYSLNPVDEVATFDNMHTLDDLDDAYTATIKGVMRTLCKQRKLGDRCGSELREQPLATPPRILPRWRDVKRIMRPRVP